MRSIWKDLLIGLLVAVLLFGTMVLSAKISFQGQGLYLQTEQVRTSPDWGSILRDIDRIMRGIQDQIDRAREQQRERRNER